MVGYPLNNRPIKNARRDNTVSTILDGHRSYDALQYSIKFWQGQKEHHIRKCDPNTGNKTDKKISSVNTRREYPSVSPAIAPIYCGYVC